MTKKDDCQLCDALLCYMYVDSEVDKLSHLLRPLALECDVVYGRPHVSNGMEIVDSSMIAVVKVNANALGVDLGTFGFSQKFC